MIRAKAYAVRKAESAQDNGQEHHQGKAPIQHGEV